MGTALVSEKRKVRINVYRFLGRTLMCPENELKIGKILVGVTPIKRIDPLGFYTYVMDGKQEYSVSKKRLQRIRAMEISWVRKPYMTYAQEMAEQIDAIKKHYLTLKEHKKSKSKPKKKSHEPKI